MTTQTQEPMVRFQLYVTKEQQAFLRRIARERGISGGYAMREGLLLYAKKHGTLLDAGPRTNL